MAEQLEATELTYADQAVRELIESLDGTTTALQNAQETLVNEHVELTSQLANHIEDLDAHGAGMILKIRDAMPRPVWNGTALGFQSQDGSIQVMPMDLKGCKGDKGDPARVPLSDEVDSSCTHVAASALAVKKAYDKALAALEETAKLAVSVPGLVPVKAQGGIGKTAENELYLKLAASGGLKTGSDGSVYIDFSGMTTQQLAALLGQIAQTGSGLTLTGDGKLKLDLAQMAGNGLVASGGKLAVNFASLPGADLKNLVEQLPGANSGLAAGTDGKLKVDAAALAGDGLAAASGKLKVDFSQMPSSTLRPMLLSLVQLNQGLGVNSDGKLCLDVNSMDKNFVHEMQKELHIPIWLDESDQKEFIVSQTFTGTRSGAPGSSTNPFGTISSAVKYVCANFNMVDETATILVGPGIYNENVGIGKFSVTTGKVLIKGPDSGIATLKGYIYADGAGPVVFENITIPNIAGNSAGTQFTIPVRLENGSILTFKNCKMELSTAITTAGLRCFHVASGSILTLDGGSESAPGFTLTNSLTSGIKNFFYIDNATVKQICNCQILSGNPNFEDAFTLATNMAQFSVAKLGSWTSWPAWSGSAQGKHYAASLNSIIYTHAAGDEFFPGGLDGTKVTGAQYS